MANSFDKIIGYDSIKEELLKLCDMIKNREIYDRLGAKLPQGVLLYGDPGLGKTLMAKCFTEESGLTTYTIRKNKGSNNFTDCITETFNVAKANSPSVILLDDMDKFANEDTFHCDTEEYVAIQAGIDDVKGYDVFVIATANDINKLPDSLLRTGRFDIKINVMSPTDSDAEKIISYYLKDKKLSDTVNMEDIAKMMSYSSCSDLETILNDAAINAAYERSDSIEMKHIVSSVLRMEYDSPDNLTTLDFSEIERTALHEASHLVVAEVLNEGSVGLASVRTKGRDFEGGFIHCCKQIKRRPHDVMVSLASKAGVELYYSDTVASGCQSDLGRAFGRLREGINSSATMGLSMLYPSDRYADPSQDYLARSEAVTYAELERYMVMTKDVLIKNREFLEKTRDALIEKETLLYSDIRAIRNSCTIYPVTIAL